ncbi:MFS transporter [Tissierella sp. MB52-C2]|uniref:MFS transporter n=1 Tax=Tissierella sp. MB52-C2 TaxID=3070999 RepID=UPI00280A96C6|nr:MFS transporter [Tissierella sp. MB52-C2]WMM23637.1 MFS transporter [Tissierella sp. MB52-C2]
MKNKTERRNFILFSLGKFVSIFGASIYSFAIGLYVLEITGSGLNFALSLIVSSIPMLIINPFAGVLADKFDKKKIVVMMDIVNGTFLMLIYIISCIYGLSLPIIYISTFITTIFSTIFGISMEAAIPNIVSKDMLMNINSISKIIDSISSILGPMVGGLVFAFIDIKYFILLCGIFYVISGVSEMFIDFRYNYHGHEENENNINFVEDMKKGFEYIMERKDIIGIFTVFISINFFMGLSVTVPLPYIINNVLTLGSKSLGIIQSGFPVGMIIGALLIKRIMKKIEYKKVLMFSSFTLGICTILLGIPILFKNMAFTTIMYTLYYCGVVVVFGVTISCIDIPIMYMLQKMIPDEYRGRVLSIVMSTVKIILPIGLILSGYLLNRIPIYFITTVGGILLFLTNALSLNSKKTIFSDVSKEN